MSFKKQIYFFFVNYHVFKLQMGFFISWSESNLKTHVNYDKWRKTRAVCPISSQKVLKNVQLHVMFLPQVMTIIYLITFTQNGSQFIYIVYFILFN